VKKKMKMDGFTIMNMICSKFGRCRRHRMGGMVVSTIVGNAFFSARCRIVRDFSTVDFAMTNPSKDMKWIVSKLKRFSARGVV